jgi:beta-galactosidase
VPDPLPLLRMLNALAKAEDPSRPTTLATCCEDRGMVEVPIAAEATDAAGANRYFGWYYGKPQALSEHLDTLHARRPSQPLSVSEYGAGGATTIHSDDPLGGPIDISGAVQPEEYQAWVHEETWRILRTKPYLWATWLWNGFDFATTVRREGDSQDINTKGLITYDRKVKKDAFYFYKANWTRTPTVHINGRRYVDRAYPVTDVRVYSNARVTQLKLNGRLLGSRTACPDRICVWPNVRLAAGDNDLVATGAFPAGPVADAISWRLAPSSARSFRIDCGSIVAAGGGSFGSDAYFEGGSPGTMDTIRRGRPPVLAAITGTPSRDRAASFREGAFRYRIPTGNGRYRVTLTFVEPSAAPGERQFDVAANGRTALAALDIAAAAGSPLAGVTRRFAVDASQGVLELAFLPRKGKAIVSAIEVEPD